MTRRRKTAREQLALPLGRYRSFQDVIHLWPTKRELSEDLGVLLSRVEKWYVRDTLPGPAWSAAVSSAQVRGIALDYEDLAVLAARRLA